MRYEKDEATYILGTFDSGDTVTITIYKLSDNSIVVNNASCSEIGSSGVFKYSFSQAISSKEEYLYIMSNGSYNKYGKIVLGGWMDDLEASIWSYATRTLTQYPSSGGGASIAIVAKHTKKLEKKLDKIFKKIDKLNDTLNENTENILQDFRLTLKVVNEKFEDLSKLISLIKISTEMLSKDDKIKLLEDKLISLLNSLMNDIENIFSVCIKLLPNEMLEEIKNDLRDENDFK